MWLRAAVIPTGTIAELQLINQAHLYEGAKGTVDGSIRYARVYALNTLEDLHGRRVVVGPANHLKNCKPLRSQTRPGFFQSDPAPSLLRLSLSLSWSSRSVQNEPYSRFTDTDVMFRRKAERTCDGFVSWQESDV